MTRTQPLQTLCSSSKLNLHCKKTDPRENPETPPDIYANNLRSTILAKSPWDITTFSCVFTIDLK